MDIDFKITTWERVSVPEEHEQKILELIKTGEISSSEQVFLALGSEADCLDFQRLGNVDVQMTPEENGGNSTIEVMDDDFNTIWVNGNF